MSQGCIVAVSLLAALMLAPVATIAQVGSSTPSKSDASTQQVSAQITEAGSASAKTATTDESRQTESQDDNVIHAREVRYERFFVLALNWDRLAKQSAADGQGVVAEALHERLSRVAGLTKDEATDVLTVALEWREDVQTSSRNALKVISAVRAANPGVHMDHKNSPEINAIYGQRWKITNSAIDQLQITLRATSFSKLDHFTHHMESYEKAVR